MKDLLIGEINDENYWRQLCPELTVKEDKIATVQQSVFSLNDDDIKKYKNELCTKGYFRLNSSMLLWEKELLEKIVRSIELLRSKGWPPHFILIFNEIWKIGHQFSKILEQTSNNKLNMDLLAWYIDPKLNQSGFSPHRDRMPKDKPGQTPGTAVKKSFHDDNTPKYTSIWLPLTNATPDNSCLYFIPANEDPYYAIGDPIDMEPLDAVLPRDNLSSLQKIRCMPCTPGSPLVFSHRLIHWAGRSNPDCTDGPRVALGFAFSDNSFEKPYFSRKYLPLPPFQLRVALAAGQAIKYNNRFQFHINTLSLFHRVLNLKSSEFDETYMLSVRGDFQFAKWKAQQQRTNTNNANSETKTCNTSSSDLLQKDSKNSKKSSKRKNNTRANKDNAIVEAPLEVFGTEKSVFNSLFGNDSSSDESSSTDESSAGH
eukprot:g2845.t1